MAKNLEQWVPLSLVVMLALGLVYLAYRDSQDNCSFKRELNKVISKQEVRVIKV